MEKLILSMDQARDEKNKACGMYNNSRVLSVEEANSRKPSFLEQLAKKELNKIQC